MHYELQICIELPDRWFTLCKVEDDAKLLAVIGPLIRAIRMTEFIFRILPIPGKLGELA